MVVVVPVEPEHAANTVAERATARPTARTRGERTGETLPVHHCAPHRERSGDTCDVGFDPHRKQTRTPFDYVMVGAAFAIVIALVVWAFLG